MPPPGPHEDTVDPRSAMPASLIFPGHVSFLRCRARLSPQRLVHYRPRQGSCCAPLAGLTAGPVALPPERAEHRNRSPSRPTTSSYSTRPTIADCGSRVRTGAVPMTPARFDRRQSWLLSSNRRLRRWQPLVVNPTSRPPNFLNQAKPAASDSLASAGHTPFSSVEHSPNTPWKTSDNGTAQHRLLLAQSPELRIHRRLRPELGLAHSR